jgi:hypothetical protein
MISFNANLEGFSGETHPLSDPSSPDAVANELQ